jgi:hypothetical protein
MAGDAVTDWLDHGLDGRSPKAVSTYRGAVTGKAVTVLCLAGGCAAGLPTRGAIG